MAAPKPNKMTSAIPNLDYLLQRDPNFYFSYNLEEEKFQYQNPALKAFLKPEENASIKQLVEMIHSDDRDYMTRTYNDLESGLFREAVEFRVIIQQHTYFLRLNAIVDEQPPKQLMGHVQNITNEKAYINKLTEYTNKKNAVLNIVSHDLAGPLGAIQMLSELLKQKIKAAKPEDVDKILSMMEHNCKKGVKMVQDFIKKEFLESIGVELQLKRTNIVEKLERVIEEYKASELHLNLNFKLNCALPEIYIMIDETKFIQAINNLISNSIKFTPDGGSIALNLSVKENKLRIEVADTGIGIPEKFHEKLFDKFNLAGRTGLKGENSVGLGMSIIKTIIEWHEGKIWFKSEENKGTSFFIELNVSN